MVVEYTCVSNRQFLVIILNPLVWWRSTMRSRSPCFMQLLEAHECHQEQQQNQHRLSDRG